MQTGTVSWLKSVVCTSGCTPARYRVRSSCESCRARSVLSVRTAYRSSSSCTNRVTNLTCIKLEVFRVCPCLHPQYDLEISYQNDIMIDPNNSGNMYIYIFVCMCGGSWRAGEAATAGANSVSGPAECPTGGTDQVDRSASPARGRAKAGGRDEDGAGGARSAAAFVQ